MKHFDHSEKEIDRDKVRCMFEKTRELEDEVCLQLLKKRGWTHSQIA